MLFAWHSLAGERYFTRAEVNRSLTDAQVGAALAPFNHRAARQAGNLMLVHGGGLPTDVQIAVMVSALATDPWAADLLAATAALHLGAGRVNEAAEMAGLAARLQPMNAEYRKLAEMAERALKESTR